jgi:chromosome segregation ATPase
MSNVAVRDMKEIGKEITQEENRLERVKEEVQKQQQTLNAISAEISKKSNDFNIYMAQKDAEVKKSHADMLIEREQLQKEKNEFMEIMKQHKESKTLLETDKKNFEIQKLRFDATTQNVKEFISAVRRANGLLGI